MNVLLSSILYKIMFYLFLIHIFVLPIYGKSSYNSLKKTLCYNLSPKTSFTQLNVKHNRDEIVNTDLGVFQVKFSYDFDKAFINILDYRIPVTPEELSYYQDIIEGSLLSENQFVLKSILFSMGVDIKLVKVKQINVKTVPDKLDAGSWYVWKIDVVLSNSQKYEFVSKIVIGQNNIMAVKDVLEAHNVLNEKEIIPELYLYKKYKGEHVFFVEYINSENSLKDDELIAEKTFYTWYYSSSDINKRWIFGDGDDTSRGNIRFFKNSKGLIDARIVDNENHQYYSKIIDIYNYLIDVGHDSKKVTKALNKILTMFPELLTSFDRSNNSILYSS